MAADTFTYLKSDYSSARDAAIQRLRARYPGIWNDFSTGSFGVMILDQLAYTQATQSYTANRLAGENFISTMTLRESAVRLGNNVTYRLRSAAPAIVPCDATLAAAAPADLTISAGTQVRTGDALAVVFELVSDVTISAGNVSPQKTAVTFNPSSVGARVIESLITLTAGEAYADCIDTTVDLREFVSVGQLLIPDGQTDAYQIVSVETTPGSSSYNRMVLATAWAGATSATTAIVQDRRIFFVQGQTQVDQVETPASDTANFVMKLSAAPVIDGSVAVTVNGNDWIEVANLATADGELQAFQVKTLPTGVTVVMFGDDIFGAAVPANGVVSAAYRTGGGAVGNVLTQAINTTITGFVANQSNPLSVAVVNNQPGTGGLEAETLEEARLNIPAFTRANDRAVTLSDYQSLATSFASPYGQVRFARAVVRGQNSLLEGNVVVVYAWSAGPSNQLTALSSPLKSALQEYLQSWAVGTDYVLIADGTQQPLPLAVLFKTAVGYSAPVVSGLVRDAAAAYVASLAPGDTVVYADLFSTVLGVVGVSSLTFATPTNNVSPVNNVVVFSAPGDFSEYPVTLTSAAAGYFTGQLPMAPLAPWAFTASLGGQPLVVVPDNTPGYARLLGGPLDDAQVSTINMATGLAQLYASNPVTDFIITLTTAAGYERDRVIDLYAGYVGDISQAKRREVRSCLRAWAGGLAVGATIYANEISGVRASTVNMDSVISNVDGVDSVTYTAIGAPANSSPRLDVGEYERVSVRNIFINNNAD